MFEAMRIFRAPVGREFARDGGFQHRLTIAREQLLDRTQSLLALVETREKRFDFLRDTELFIDRGQRE